jgi:hypothetical protein
MIDSRGFKFTDKYGQGTNEDKPTELDLVNRECAKLFVENLELRKRNRELEKSYDYTKLTDGDVAFIAVVVGVVCIALGVFVGVSL